jgi:deaminated glutathione amidase
MPIAAVLQMTSTASVAANLTTARTLLEQAHAGGATLAVLPENFAIMGRSETDKLGVAEDLGEGPIQSFLAHSARELGLWIICGTIPIKSAAAPGAVAPGAVAPDRVAAASLVFDDRGRFVARYDKIHMFDVDIPDREERYRESATIAPGEGTTVVATPIGHVGLSVCYDMRFPELFRTLSAQGAEVLSVPSAFTAPTGRAHWELLLRARAVENLCFVLAAAQGGIHENGRETYGDSLIVDPWGQVLARVAEPGPGVALAEIDLTLQADLRTRFPVLSHRRL